MTTPAVNVYNKYQGNGATTEFSIGFPYKQQSYVKVYVKRADGDEQLMNSSDYSFVNTSTLKFPSTTSSETVLAVGDVITIQRETPLENQYEFSNQKRLFPADVMAADDLDMQILQEQARDMDRAIKVSPTSSIDPDTLVQEVERVYNSIDNIDTVADNISNINSVAGNATNINAVAGDLTNIDAVAENATNIDAVAGNATNINSVAGDLTNIDTVATNIAKVNDVSDNMASISGVYSNISAISAVNSNATNINAVAGNETNINAVNANKTNIDAVAGNSTNINSVVSDLTNINSVAGDLTNIDAVAGNATNINAVNSNKTNIDTVATNISDINTCSSNMAAISAAPTSATNAANSALAAAESAALSAQYANDKINQTHISNCITEIPNDIKLVVSAGSMVLKAGSKVCYPDGFEQDGTTPKFTYKTIETDLTRSDTVATTKNSITYVVDENRILGSYKTFSGLTAPTFIGQGIWYDTTNNRIKRSVDGGLTWDSVKIAFPLGLCTNNGSGYTSIDRIFNGFCCIGNRLVVFPGVKGLIAKGRNQDGTLKSREFTTDRFVMGDAVSSGWGGKWSVYFNENAIAFHPAELEYISDSEPSIWAPTSYWYSPRNNYLYYTQDTGSTWSETDWLSCIEIYEESTQIKDLITAKTLRVADANTSVSTKTNNTFSGTNTFNGATTQNGALTVSGTAIFGNTATFNGANTMNGTFTLNNAATLNGTCTVNSSLLSRQSGNDYYYFMDRLDLATNGTTPDANKFEIILARAANNSDVGGIQLTQGSNGTYSTSLICTSKVSGSTVQATLKVGIAPGGGAFAQAITPTSSHDNSKAIATTAWVQTWSAHADTMALFDSYAVPKYSAGVSGLSGTASTNGWLVVKNNGLYTQADAIVTIDSVTVASLNGGSSICLGIKLGKAYAVTGGINPTCTFYPCNGG